MDGTKRLTTEAERKDLIRCLKLRHDAQFTPGVYEHSVIGRAALFLEETADAVEVVHGEWEITKDDYFDLVEMKCSVCGESYGFEDYEDDTPKNYHYCPNCGAKMDGDGNG